MLELRGLGASYGRGTVLSGLDLAVPQGRFATLIGANGAGKSTTMRAVSGLLRPVSGQVLFEGRDLSRLSADRIARLGLALVPEGRKIFASMTVRENLEMGAFQFLFPRNRGRLDERLDFVFGQFPRLRERAAQIAGTLSGGEQQMLAIGRALMSDPRMLLLDEPSMGLAPMVVHQIFATLRRLADQGLTLLVCEQNTAVALRSADHGHVLEAGRIALEGPAQELVGSARIREAYLGV